MDTTRDYHVKWSKSDGKKQMLFHLYVGSKQQNKWTNKTQQDSQVQRTDGGYQREGGWGVGKKGKGDQEV